jgi:effector-binding domain-containing protein
MTLGAKAAAATVTIVVLTLMFSSPSWTQPPPTPQASPPAPQTSPSTTPSEQESAPAAPAKPETADAFGEEVTLTPKSIILIKGTATWDNAFDTLVNAFKSVKSAAEREKLAITGSFMTIYTATDDTGFQFQAAVPIEGEPKTPLRGDVSVGKSPGGRALKFVHRGSYDSMDATYDAITNLLDERKLDAKDLFIEEYVTDPLTTPADKLVINVFVPVQ